MAEKPAVHPDMAVGEALRAIARDVLSEARGALDNQDKPNAVAVHDYRKAMKRWRALLRLLQPFLGDEGQHLRIEARDFARELAGARDAQAAIEALEELVESKYRSRRAQLRRSAAGSTDPARRGGRDADAGGARAAHHRAGEYRQRGRGAGRWSS